MPDLTVGTVIECCRNRDRITSEYAIFGLVASCRLHSIDPQQYLDAGGGALVLPGAGGLHSIDPQQYLDEVMRVLPYCPDSVP